MTIAPLLPKLKEWSTPKYLLERAQKIDDLHALIKSSARFGAIMADPPWQYNEKHVGHDGKSGAETQYPTMHVKEIAALPVRRLALASSHLHLWTTNAFLFECPRIMEAWGFEYKSCFVWVKPRIGMGRYWRVSHEFLLLGVRGNLPFLDHSLRSWAELAAGAHSVKPGAIRRLVERASPGPWLELFGRCERPGWTVWGNELKRWADRGDGRK